MVIFIICVLILIGFFLILLEFLVVPGITVAGLGGLAFIAGGVYMSYDNFGNKIGNYTVLVVFILLLIVLYFALRSRTWKNLMLRSSVDSKSNEIDEDKIKIGDEGTTISRLAPMGKVIVNDEYYEAKSLHKFIDENTEIIVTKILNTNIIVKPKN